MRYFPIVRLFVYGTLRPGDVRWPLLEPFVDGGGQPDHVRGWLYDTGLGYPAAIFHGTGHPAAPTVASASSLTPADVDADADATIVIGRTFTLVETSSRRALEVLDHEEDTVDGLYRRVEVTTGNGVAAWAYEYGSGLDLMPIGSGDWFTRTMA